MQLNTRRKKIFAIVWAWFEIFLFAGMFFGWGSLVLMLKEDGVYGELCENTSNNLTHTPSNLYQEETFNDTSNEHAHSVTHQRRARGCPEQDKTFNLGFAISSGIWPYLFGLISHLGHRFGLRFIRLVTSVNFIIGTFLVAFTEPDKPFLVFIGIFLFGSSGCGLLFSNLQLSYLFRRGRTVVCGLMTGAFDSSIATQLYLKLAYDAGVLRKYCYIFLGCIHLITFISTFGWLPKMYIKLPETREETVEIDHDDNKKIGNELLENPGAVIHTDRNDNIDDIEDDTSSHLQESHKDLEGKDMTLRQLVCSPVYMMHIFWYSVLQLRFLYFVGTLNPWLVRISKSEEEVSRLTNESMYCMMGGIVTSFVAGTLFDCQKERFKDSKNKLRRQLGPVVLPLAVGSLLGVIVSVMQMIPHKIAVYAAFISLTMFRSFLYAIGNGYLSIMNSEWKTVLSSAGWIAEGLKQWHIARRPFTIFAIATSAERFPSKFFSALSGLLMVLTGSACFFQYAFFNWTESYSDAYMHVDIFLLCMTCTSLIHPVYQWWRCRKSTNG